MTLGLETEMWPRDLSFSEPSRGGCTEVHGQLTVPLLVKTGQQTLTTETDFLLVNSVNRPSGVSAAWQLMFIIASQTKIFRNIFKKGPRQMELCSEKV